MQAETARHLTSIWFVDLILGLSILIFLNYLTKRILHKVRKRYPKVKNGWHEKLDSIFFVPIHALLWVLACLLVLEVTAREFSFTLFSGYINPLRASSIIFALAWMLLRWTKALHQGKIRSLADASFVHLWGRIVTVIIVALTALTLLQLWGLNIGPLIAFGGIGAAAVGFASKDVISNFCGGLMLSITRPFIPGDLIQIADMKLEGHVEEIGWYLTSVRDKEKKAVYLPNAIFSNALVINCSRMTHRRIRESLSLRYEDYKKIKGATEKIQQVLKSHPKIDPSFPVLISLISVGSYSLEIELDVYTQETPLPLYLQVKQEILLLLCQMLKDEGLEFASPAWVQIPS